MRLVKIESIEEFDYSGEVIDLNVDEDHSYNVEGYVVHNSDFVMLGGMLAGHDEGGGEIITEFHENSEYYITTVNGIPELVQCDPIAKQFVQFYGMSSETAMEKHHGGVAEYRSSEGRTVKVPYKGPVAKTVQDILGGVRSTCTYVGAKSLKDLSKCTTFVRVNKQFNSVFLEKR
jgi:GMP reductase